MKTLSIIFFITLSFIASAIVQPANFTFSYSVPSCDVNGVMVQVIHNPTFPTLADCQGYQLAMHNGETVLESCHKILNGIAPISYK